MNLFLCSIRTYIRLNLRVALLFCLAISLGCSKSLAAQAPQKKDSVRTTTLRFADRWGFRTNAVDWLLLMPNVGVDFDLSPSIYNNSVLSLNVRGNWRTSSTYKPARFFNALDGRMEYRHYWRTQLGSKNDTVSFLQKLFSKKRENPRYWRAYYLGGYVDANRYSFRLGEHVSYQGHSYGAGIMAGFGIPLYTFSHGYVDVELGAAVGVALAETDKFDYNRSGDCYVVSEHKAMHIVPYPIVHDLHVSFIYRFKSVKEKYGKVNEARIERKQAKAQQKQARRDSIQHARDSVKALAAEARLARKAERLQERRRDSIRAAQLDSLKAVADSLKQAGKAMPADTEAEVPTLDQLIVQEPLPADTTANAKQRAPKQKKAKKEKAAEPKAKKEKTDEPKAKKEKPSKKKKEKDAAEPSANEEETPQTDAAQRPSSATRRRLFPAHTDGEA
ncbi:MAG: DUF3575 domain-containing protein [Bacteroidaceae bacterium]